MTIGYDEEKRREAHLELLESINQELEADPNNPALYARRARHHALTKEYELALADYDRAITLEPNALRVYESRANTYEEAGQYQQAIADYTYFIERVGDTISAIANHKGVIIKIPVGAGAYQRRGTCYHALGQYELAIADYTKALEVDPKNNTLARATAYFALGQYDQAIADFTAFFERAKTASAERIEAYALRGYSSSKLGDYHLAIADFSMALDIARRWFQGYKDVMVSSYLNRGFAYMKTGDYHQAAADLERAMSFDASGSPADNSPAPETQQTSKVDEPRNRGAILEWIRSRPKTGLPAPTDEEVAQWIDEHWMEKYG